MLSREELLDTESYNEGKLFNYSNKIVISNKDETDAYSRIGYRIDLTNIHAEENVTQSLSLIEPKLINLFEKYLKVPLGKLRKDIKEDGVSLAIELFKAISNESKRDEIFLNLAKKYGFIRPNANSFNEVSHIIEKALLPSHTSELVDLETVKTFHIVSKSIRDMLYNYGFKKMYSTNQVLVNYLESDDNFKSRLSMFSNLYEAGILLNTDEDSFLECLNCEPRVYKGIMSLKINPNKLSKLNCPVCNHTLTYFIPYELNEEIYSIISQPDGIIIDALSHLLEESAIEYELNKSYLNDIEIDCSFKLDDTRYIVETKMFKTKNKAERHLSKVKEAYHKLLKDVKRLNDDKIFGEYRLVPVLLTNIIDDSKIYEYTNKLNAELDSNNVFIYNLKGIKAFLKEKLD